MCALEIVFLCDSDCSIVQAFVSNSIAFFFEGTRIQTTQTAGELDMEDEDGIDAMRLHEAD